MSDFFRRYLLPGFVFQSAVIAGGYATGRELVEFFLPAGPWGGLLGMVVSMLVWSLVLMVSFELARVARAYDYRSFFKLLLGRGWFLFEIGYFALIDHHPGGDGRRRRRDRAQPVRPAEAGRLAGHDRRHRPDAVLQQRGDREIPRRVGGLSVPGLLRVPGLELVAFGDRIEADFAAEPVSGGWFKAGVTYAGYNVATIPAVLFCIRHLGAVARRWSRARSPGPLGMLPGVVFYIAMMGYYDEIGAEALPSAFLLAKLRAVVRMGVPDRGAADPGGHRCGAAACDQRTRGQGLRGTPTADAARAASGPCCQGDDALGVRRQPSACRSDRQGLRPAHVRVHRAADPARSHRGHPSHPPIGDDGSRLSALRAKDGIWRAESL